MTNQPPRQVTYQDLVIRLRRQTHWDDSEQLPKDLRPATWGDAAVFQAEVRQTPFPLQGGAFRIDITEQLAAFQQVFGDQIKLSRHFYDYSNPPAPATPAYAAAADDLAALGNALYKLLPLSFHEELPSLIQRTLEQGHGLRLILEAHAGDQADRLLSLPWELLFLEDTRAHLVRTPRFLIVRRLLDAVRQNPVSMTPPYTTVHVIAHSPTGPIDMTLQKAEQEILCEVMGAERYHLVSEPGSVEGLLAALQSTPTQIVHFLGHGEFHGQDASAQVFSARTYLRFVDPQGQPQYVTGEQFQHLLGGMPGVQLIVLSSCHGGAAAANNIALDLVYSGFPYVVAIQGEITQDAARHFIQAFYRKLQQGHSIEYAVAAGRFAIYAHLPGALDWCLPVFYTNVGLADKGLLPETIAQIEQWFRRPHLAHPLASLSFFLGGAHLATGLQLWLAGTTIYLPNATTLALLLGWIGLAPPVVAWLVFRYGALPMPADWPPSTRRALQVRILSAAAIGTGLPLLYVVWFNLILCVGIGLWALLPSAGHLLLLGLLGVGTLLISYAQARSHGLGFITSARVDDIPFVWSELLMVVVGYAMIMLPLLLLYRWPDFLAPPLSNLLIGVITVGVAYLLYHESIVTKSTA
ncbi:MAG: CHAT domain-containing protein [Caldilineaceae bacterium]|nr:CHAT domain-containing protein [Caldilineaceae bacterium]